MPSDEGSDWPKQQGEEQDHDSADDQWKVPIAILIPWRMLKYENALIKQALMQANGSVTHAASLLGLSYQALCYMIESRHKDLLEARSPIRRRKSSEK